MERFLRHGTISHNLKQRFLGHEIISHNLKQRFLGHGLTSYNLKTEISKMWNHVVQSHVREISEIPNQADILEVWNHISEL